MSFTLLWKYGSVATTVAEVHCTVQRGTEIVKELNDWVTAQLTVHPEVPMPTPDDDESIKRWDARKARIDALIPLSSEATQIPAVVEAARSAVLWAEGSFAAE